MTAGGARTGFYKYTVATNTWTTVASVPGTVTSGSAMAYDSANNKIYLTRGGTQIDLYRFSPNTEVYHRSGYITKRHDLTYVSAFNTLTANSTTPANTAVSFQTRSSTDSNTWTSWQALSGSNIQSTAGRYLEVKTTLTSSDGASTPTLADYTISYEGDATAPTNPTVSGYSDSTQTTSLTSGQSYTYTNPYFSWSAASDAQTSTVGYYVYFGTSSTADPVTAGSYQTNLFYQVHEPMVYGTLYYLRIASKDTIGNVSSATSAFTFTYNGISPHSTVTKTNEADFTLGTLDNTEASSSATSLKLGQNQLGKFNIQSVPTAVTYGSGLVYNNGYLYTSPGGSSTTFYRYDTSVNTWSTMTANSVMPFHAIYQQAMTTAGSFVYAFRNDAATFSRYSISGNSWSAMTNAPGNFSPYGSTITSDGSTYLYAFQGYSTAFWRYDIGANSWTSMASGPTKTGYGASLVYNEDTNAIYATPGYDIDNQNNHLRQFWKYDIATNAWSQLAEVPLTYQVQGGGMVYDGSANI